MKARLLLMLVATTALGGCIASPHLGTAPQPRPPASFAADRNLAATPGAKWAGKEWWHAYGDPELDTLIGEALANAPTMAQASARLARAQAITVGTNASLLPAIGASASISGAKPSSQNGIPVTPERRGWNDYEKASLGLSWEIDFWGKNRNALAAAVSDRRAAEVDLAAASLLVSTSVAAAYADLARLYADRDVLDATLAVREHSLALVKARVREGIDSDADLSQAEAGPAAAKLDLSQVDESIGVARDRLAALMGAGPDRGMDIARPSTPNLASRGLPGNLPAELIGRRPDIVAARWRAEAAARRIDVAHAQFYPNVNLVGFIGLDALSFGRLVSTGSGTGGVGAAIDLPIFDGGRRRGNYGVARAEYDLAVAGYNETVTQALRDVADVVQGGRRIDAQRAAAHQALMAQERAYRLAEDRYKSGVTDYQAVLNIEDRLLARRRVAAAVDARAFLIDVAIIRAIGGGVLAADATPVQVAIKVRD